MKSSINLTYQDFSLTAKPKRKQGLSMTYFNKNHLEVKDPPLLELKEKISSGIRELSVMSTLSEKVRNALIILS